MSDSVSKYYKMLEDQEYWESKEKTISRFERIKAFFSRLFNLKK